MTRAGNEMLLSRLHLHAVLPALEALVKIVPQAREAIARANFSLGLRVADGPSAMVSAADGVVRVDPAVAVSGGTVLHFFRPRHLNAIFLQRSAPPPLPVRGWLQFARLLPFLRLARVLDATLQPSEAALDDDDFRRRHLLLSFQVALRAVPIVAREDVLAIRALKSTPPGLLAVRIPDLPFAAWVQWEKGVLSSDFGEPARPPDTIVTICDAETARLLLTAKIDPQAALGLGRVRVDGLIPLADGLDVLLHRVDTYLGAAARARP
ncbi:hypothetical protein AYO41_02880 [Verrucomicrobia bacterium SCGC AG-212-E04]|nr:hypothetical protein AYO41_02880 [Verrucomicrobia bacterium SCGC AG-212-E04]